MRRGLKDHIKIKVNLGSHNHSSRKYFSNSLYQSHFQQFVPNIFEVLMQQLSVGFGKDKKYFSKLSI